MSCNHYFGDDESKLLNSIELSLDNLKNFDSFFKEEYIESCKLINFFKSQGMTIEQILMQDIFDWLCYLGLCDRVSVDAEINFIRNYFNLWFDHNYIMDLINFRIDENYKNSLPISFMLFYEIESHFKRKDDFYIMEELLNMFEYIGWEFITCNGNLHPNEFYIFNEYIDILNSNMDKFKKDYYNFAAEFIISYWNSLM